MLDFCEALIELKFVYKENISAINNDYCINKSLNWHKLNLRKFLNHYSY